ncbi:integrase core domain protein [Collinsella aerofaciens ATCC 25986]|uniref:Integrase core domain protein n=10 Tax=Collinsella TaxID=102106 RepID=A4EAN7_COLAA|nr:integrase core domain protein [Collinsella aerofaciens ATCC 25986]
MTSQTRTSITVEIVSPGPSRATIEARPERAADRAPAHGRTSLPPRGPVGCCRRGTRRPRRLIGKCRAGAAAGNVSAEGEAIRSNDYRKDTTVKAPSTRPAAVLGLDVGKSSHWACLIDRDGEVLASAPVRNREAELDALFASAPAGTLVVVDQFRNIGSLAVRRARAAGLGVAHLPGLAASRAAGLLAGEAKTDERDAAVIARTALGVPDSLSGVPGRGEALEAARALSSQRDHVVACATRDKNRLRAVLLESCPALEAAVDLSDRRWLELLWIGYTDVDSSGRGAGDGRAVYEGPQAPEAFHRRVQEADSRPLQRRQAQARDHGRVRPRQEHRGEVDQVDKRDRLAARRVQPHARAEPDPGARAREPQAPDGGRRLKTSGADIRSKVRAIAANEGRYPISAQCRLLGVARSTYYSMRSRADRPAAPDPAAPAVVAAHAASKGRYGSRKIKASLERSGVTVSRRRVCRIMRENGLVSAYGRKRFKVHPGAVNEADVPNVVARGFGGRAPRTHICSDLTYVRVGASWNYVCLLVDLYNREIVGHSAGPRKDARLVKSAFATLSFPISDIEVFHTDRGSEFDNAEIDLMLEAFGIERSLSAKGCPYDNAVDESTNRILKAELVHRETFGTTRELRAKLSDYVHWYNNFRIHSTLGYMSPVEFREAGLSLPESSK